MAAHPGSGTDRAVTLIDAADDHRSQVDLGDDESRYPPGAPTRVRAHALGLPFARGALGAATLSRCFVHLDGRALPRALAELHRALVEDAPVAFTFVGAGPSADEPTVTTIGRDESGERRLARWRGDDLAAVLEGGGFAVELTIEAPQAAEGPRIRAIGRRCRTLPDTVGPDMGLLICGLNPSVRAAAAGVGFVTPGNRFWPAAMAAGLVSVDRDPFHALDHHGVGMTDIVKRATARAAELTSAEYRDGMARLARVVRLLGAEAVCFVGLAGYRAAVDRGAQAGVQGHRLGGRPVYVMPSTSGLNAHSRLADLTEHLRRARALAARSARETDTDHPSSAARG